MLVTTDLTVESEQNWKTSNDMK